jgi:hypothetical protein
VIIIPFSIEKYVILWPFSAALLPSDFCAHTNSNVQFPNSLAVVSSEPTLSRLLAFHVPNLVSASRCLGRAERNFQVRGSSEYYVTGTTFYCGVVRPPLKSPAEDHLFRLSATACSVYQ